MLDFCKRVIELKETTYVENPGWISGVDEHEASNRLVDVGKERRTFRATIAQMPCNVARTSTWPARLSQI
jgi:hypothetical protein